jgi:hypothetical protein
MNNNQNIEFSLFNFLDYVINYKYILSFSFFIPLFFSSVYYFYQPKVFEYHVVLSTDNKFNYQSEESLSLQNININYQILRSLNISRDILVRMTENINPVGIISKNNYLLTLEDIVSNDNDIILQTFKNIKALEVLLTRDNDIFLKYIFFENNSPVEEINKINSFLNNKTLSKLKTAFNQVNEQFRKLTQIGNFGLTEANITNELLFAEVEKIFEKYKIFSGEENFFIDEKKTTISLVKKMRFKIVFVFVVPLLFVLFVILFTFIKLILQSYFNYKSEK